MDNNVLAKRGFSLAELSLVLMVVSLFIAASFYSAAKIRQIASAQRTINELNAIADVSTQYYLENGAWPVNLAGLRPKYLAANAGILTLLAVLYNYLRRFRGIGINAFAQRPINQQELWQRGCGCKSRQ